MNILSQIINVPHIGSVLFESSKRAKRLNISINSTARIRVAMPKGVTMQKAMELLYNKESWIKKTLNKIQACSIKKNQYKNIDTKYASNYLLNRLDVLAQLHGFRYNRVSIRNQKTRWGSCSSKNNISLNKKILYLPPELIDYVLLHELVHTKIKNHGKEFWRELDKMVPKSKKVDKRLQNYQHCLI